MQLAFFSVFTVPIFVPTPCIEALPTLARAERAEPSISLISSNIAQLRATGENACKSQKNGRLLIRNQQVAGSIPAGGSS
jgi:hypothetical protein